MFSHATLFTKKGESSYAARAALGVHDAFPRHSRAAMARDSTAWHDPTDAYVAEPHSLSLEAVPKLANEMD